MANTIPELLKEIRPWSEKELAKLPIDKAADFLIAQHQLATGHGKAHLITAVNCGRMLLIQKKVMAHGEFRTWAERGCGLKPWNVTRYMKVAKMAERFGANLEKMSANAVLRMEKPPTMDKEAIRKEREKKDKRSPTTRHRDEFKLLADRVEQALHDDKHIFGEVLAPRLKAILKEFGKTADRAKAVKGEEE